MQRTTLAISLVALLVTTAVQAQTVAPIAPSVMPGTSSHGGVAAKKQHVMARIQQKMAILQTLQSCVAAAQDETAMHNCEEQARSANGAHEKKC